MFHFCGRGLFCLLSAGNISCLSQQLKRTGQKAKLQGENTVRQKSGWSVQGQSAKLRGHRYVHSKCDGTQINYELQLGARNQADSEL